MIGSLREPDLALDPGDELEAGHVGQAEVEHHAVVARRSASASSASCAAADGGGLARRRRRSARRCSAARLVVLDHQQPLDRPVDELVQRRRARRSSDSLVAGLVRKSMAPSRRPRCQFSSTEMMCTGMWRVRRIVLEPVQDGPAVGVGQPEVQRDRGRLVLARQRQRPVGPQRHQPLEARGRAPGPAGSAAKSGSSSAMSRIRSPSSMSRRSSLIARSTTGASITRELARRERPWRPLRRPAPRRPRRRSTGRLGRRQRDRSAAGRA